MKKKNYLFKGVNTNILRIWTSQEAPELQEFIERIEYVDARVRLNTIEAMAARKSLKKFNDKYGTNLRLLKMKD